MILPPLVFPGLVDALVKSSHYPPSLIFEDYTLGVEPRGGLCSGRLHPLPSIVRLVWMCLTEKNALDYYTLVLITAATS
jgi:hypothetical protein